MLQAALLDEFLGRLLKVRCLNRLTRPTGTLSIFAENGEGRAEASHPLQIVLFYLEIAQHPAEGPELAEGSVAEGGRGDG